MIDMVLFDHNFRKRHASVVKLARKERIRCVKLEEGLFFVARKSPGHGKYLVSVDATKSGVFATCRTIRGASCPSFKICVHIAKVHEALRAELNKRERRETAA